MPFISENELERALVKAAKNLAHAPDFYRLLLESELLVLGTAEGQEGAAEQFALAAGSRLNLVTGAKDGGQFLPVFSSMARMQEYVNQESKFLRINGRALLDLTRGAPITLNPASEYGKELSPQEVQQLLDGRNTGENRTIIGEAEYPPALVAALNAVFAARSDIETAWMIEVTFADRAQEPHPLVGIELDFKTGGNWPSLMQEIHAAAAVHVPGMVFDVQRVDRQNRAGMTDALLQAVPFYQRRPRNPTLN